MANNLCPIAAFSHSFWDPRPETGLCQVLYVLGDTVSGNPWSNDGIALCIPRMRNNQHKIQRYLHSSYPWNLRVAEASSKVVSHLHVLSFEHVEASNIGYTPAVKLEACGDSDGQL